MQVSVLMTAYNAERYVSEAIKSVLSQTHGDFELVVVDDGSTDQTLSILESHAREDQRIRVISHPNIGMAESANQVIELLDNEWIVRIDSDDIMMPERIERQLRFVQGNPDVAVAATLVYYINEVGDLVGKYRSPLTSRSRVEEFIRRDKLIAFHHPSSIMRRSAVREVGGYRSEFWPADDLDLFNRIAERYMVLVQPEYLLKYRKHDSSAFSSNTRLTWEKVEWIEVCVRRRRNGLSEPSWQQFLADRGRALWWRRLNRERKYFAKVLYAAAVSHFSMRRYWAFAPVFLGAGLLQPVYVLHQITSKYGRSSVVQSR